MNYVVTIQDVDNLLDVQVLHFSEKDAIELNYLDGEYLKGSELNFQISAEGCEDGVYNYYFTSNEKKWLVTLKREDDGYVIWQGYMLPEDYTEPYQDHLYFLSFSATDGVKLLEGKTLEDKYYRDELNVIDVICACLRELKIDFPLYFAPAIVNTNEKYWHKILVDTLQWSDEKGNPNAYEVLEMLLESMQCQIYQADGKWFIEGINWRNFINLEYSVYDLDGNFIQDEVFEKPVKKLTKIETPSINLLAPYHKVIIKSDVESLELPKSIVKYKDVDFDLSKQNINNFFYNENWFSLDYLPFVKVSDNNLILSNINQAYELNENRKVELKQKPYILEGQQIQIVLEIELNINDETLDVDDDLIELWQKAFTYRISLEDEVLSFNLNRAEISAENIKYNDNGKGELELNFIASQNGYLDIELFEPLGLYSITNFTAVKVTKLKVECLNEEEESIYTHELDNESSIIKEIDLPISDSILNNSLSFYLKKRRQKGGILKTIPIPIYKDFTIDGQRYFEVPLWGAKWLDDNVYVGVSSFEYEVIYNFLGGEQMVIKADLSVTPTNFNALIREIINYKEREKDQQWSDAVYKVQKEPYNTIVAEINAKTNQIATNSLECEALNDIKINDIIRFYYKDKTRYFKIINSVWNIDAGITNLNAVECTYVGNSVGDLPPYVDTGDIVTYTELNDTVVSEFYVTAFDPDGTIESAEWIKLSGIGGNISDPNNTAPIFSQLTDDAYDYQVTVTDNNGNTATDILRLRKKVKTSIDLDVTYDFYYVGDSLNTPDVECTKIFNVSLSPNIPNEYQVNLYYTILFENSVDNAAISESMVSEILIDKNTDNRWRYNENYPAGQVANTVPEFDKEYKGVISISNNDDIEMTINLLAESFISIGVYPDLLARIRFDRYEVVNGFVEIDNIGIFEEIHAEEP